MCLICIDFQKETLTPAEAWKNLTEMKDTMTDEHYDEVVGLIVERLLENEVEAHDEEDLAETFADAETTQLSFDWGVPEYEDDDLYWNDAWSGYDEEQPHKCRKNFQSKKFHPNQLLKTQKERCLNLLSVFVCLKGTKAPLQ